ncbi:MAG: cytidylate kinase-like family protein [SAR324 cluster bacterium]|nr:cytidylate kinase-like family protein [SAR324 cluster bacterium]
MTLDFTITQGIENRLSAWNKHAKNQNQAKKKSSPCVTLSREFGCQGYAAAAALEKRLNIGKSEEEKWITLDRKLLEKIAEDSGFSKQDVQNIGDVHPIWQATLNMFAGKHSAEPYEVFSYLKKAVRYFAKTGNCIIVGRAGGIITQDLKNCIHIRLVAPLEYRIKYTMEAFNLSETESRKLIASSQKQRDAFVHNFTNVYQNTTTLYHLVINNEKHSPEQIAEIIENEIKWYRP